MQAAFGFEFGLESPVATKVGPVITEQATFLAGSAWLSD
jgi:hypothetical protein